MSLVDFRHSVGEFTFFKFDYSIKNFAFCYFRSVFRRKSTRLFGFCCIYTTLKVLWNASRNMFVVLTRKHDAHWSNLLQ